MSRLQRDIPATVAALRITRFDFTIFVESKENDSFVYGRLADSFSSLSGRAVEIRESREVLLGTQSGGKTVLESLFRAAEAANLLRSRGTAGNRIVAFILDKDVDDVLSRVILHPNVIYTPTYHVENILVLAGDLELAVRAALSLTEAEVHLIAVNWPLKVQTYAVLWKSWVNLCLLSMKLRIKFGTTYAALSAVNNPISSPCDLGRVGQILSDLEARSNLGPADFDAHRSEVEALVDGIYQAGAQDAIFKGKWYVEILIDEAVQLGLTTRGKAPHQREAIWAILRATFQPQHPLMDYFRERLVAII